MRKSSLLYLGLSLVLAVILMVTNIGCGGDAETPAESNTVSQEVVAPQPIIS